MYIDEYITRELCFLFSNQEIACRGEPVWELHNKNRCIYVCDAHLADGLRKCGLPALIDSHVPRHTVGDHKY